MPKVRLYIVLPPLFYVPSFACLDGNETINCTSIAFVTADGIGVRRSVTV